MHVFSIRKHLVSQRVVYRNLRQVLDVSTSEVERLAVDHELIADLLDHPPAPRDVETGGAARAAALIATLL